jgi:hypothetical protein
MMRFTGTKTTALVFLALFSSTFAFSAGKKHAAGGKAAKECVEKGGTWDKKKKKCDMPKDAASETPAPAESAPAESAPAGEATPNP